jgi:hypothetical protein
VRAGGHEPVPRCQRRPAAELIRPKRV